MTPGEVDVQISEDNGACQPNPGSCVIQQGIAFVPLN
jgi:hypothetical protein